MKKKTISFIGMFFTICLMLCSCASNGNGNSHVEDTLKKSLASGSISMIDVSGMLLSDAEQMLSEAGFKSVTAYNGESPIKSELDKWVVASQNVAAGAQTDKNSKIKLDCKRVTHSLYIDIDFHANLFFSTYNVELFLDGKKIDTLPHGKYYTKLIEVDDGNHELKLIKENGAVSTSKTVLVDQDCTLRMEITTSKNEITVNETKIDSISGTEIVMLDVKGLLLSEALDKLKGEGFVNIESKADDGDTIWVDENWTVISQSVGLGEKIDKNNKIILTCQQTEKLLHSRYKKLDTASIVKDVQLTGYHAEYKDAETYDVITGTINISSDEKRNDWIFDRVSVISSSEKKITVYLKFNGKIEIPYIVGLHASDAKQVLKKAGFTNVALSVEGGRTILDDSAWVVIKQNPNAGVSIKRNESISLNLHQNKAAYFASGKDNDFYCLFDFDEGIARTFSTLDSSARIAKISGTLTTKLTLNFACNGKKWVERATFKDGNERTLHFINENGANYDLSLGKVSSAEKYLNGPPRIEDIPSEAEDDTITPSSAPIISSSPTPKISNSDLPSKAEDTILDKGGETDLSAILTVENLDVDTRSIPDEATEEETNNTPPSLEVLVTLPPEIDVKALDVIPDTIKLFPGEKAILKAEITPNDATDKAVIWTSSNEDVVTVDDSGEIFAISPGKADIIATASNGIPSSASVEVKCESKTSTLRCGCSRLDNNRIGNEWFYQYEINGEAVKNGDYLLNVGDVLTLSAEFTEEDTRPDIGKASTSHTVTESDLINGFTEEMDLIVTENAGKNSGQSAEFLVEFSFTVK